MLYPLIIQSVELPLGPFSIYLPDPLMVNDFFRKQQQAIGSEPSPYWARLWPSSIALATFIQQNPEYTNGKIVAELAAGLGLPSLAAAAHTKRVWCSDISPEAMQVAKESAQLHQLANIEFCACNWNDLPSDFQAETVLLSDINYEPAAFDELEKVVMGLLEKGCTLLLATPQRLMAKPFITTLLPFVADRHIVAVEENGQFIDINIFLLKINR